MGTDRVGDINKEQERKNENNGSSKHENDTTRVQSGGTERCGIVVEREREREEGERERERETAGGGTNEHGTYIQDKNLQRHTWSGDRRQVMTCHIMERSG